MTTTLLGPQRGRPAGARLAGLRERILRVAEAAATPLLPSDFLDIVNPLLSGADLRGRIVAIEPETRDAVTVTIRPGRGWRGHTPGQYVRIGVDVDGVRQWRAYSVTSPASRSDGHFTITVKAIPDGVVSNHLVRRAAPGAVIQLDQAAGDFVLPQVTPAKLLFVTGGSGITPVMGILRSYAARTPAELRDVVVVHSAPTREDVIFAADLAELAADDRIRLTTIHTDADGLLDPARLEQLVPDLASRETWACGPTGMLDMLEEHWATRGLVGPSGQSRLHTERFRASVIATGDGGTVTFTQGGQTVEIDGATPILDAAEAAGILMPSGCRMGICFGCVLPMREGAVRDLRTGELTTASPGDGVMVQTCISAAAGDCDLDH